jgi:hypothetical protein
MYVCLLEYRVWGEGGGWIWKGELKNTLEVKLNHNKEVISIPAVLLLLQLSHQRMLQKLP